MRAPPHILLSEDETNVFPQFQHDGLPTPQQGDLDRNGDQREDGDWISMSEETHLEDQGDIVGLNLLADQ